MSVCIAIVTTMAASTSLPGQQKLSFSPTKQFLGRLLLSGCLEKGRPTIMGRTFAFVSKTRVSLGDLKDVNAYVERNNEHCKKIRIGRKSPGYLIDF